MTEKQAKEATMVEMAEWRSTFLAKLRAYREGKMNIDIRYVDKDDGVDKLFCTISNCILRVSDESVLEIYELVQKDFGKAYYV